MKINQILDNNEEDIGEDLDFNSEETLQEISSLIILNKFDEAIASCEKWLKETPITDEKYISIRHILLQLKKI